MKKFLTFIVAMFIGIFAVSADSKKYISEDGKRFFTFDKTQCIHQPGLERYDCSSLISNIGRKINGLVTKNENVDFGIYPGTGKYDVVNSIYFANQFLLADDNPIMLEGNDNKFLNSFSVCIQKDHVTTYTRFKIGIYVSDFDKPSGIDNPWYDELFSTDGWGDPDCETYVLVTDDMEDEDIIYNYCPYFSEKVSEIDKKINEYNAAKTPQLITEYKEEVEQLSSACKSISKNISYSDPCVPACLELSSYKKNWDKKLGIGVNNSKCGLSGRILIWIGNIIKWVKYLIPVVIIILSILDFIKAIASDKDDEMKKAQKKFITRLIAAVLIFITPIIIEFILGKIGFNANGCGIIDL